MKDESETHDILQMDDFIKNKLQDEKKRREKLSVEKYQLEKIKQTQNERDKQITDKKIENINELLETSNSDTSFAEYIFMSQELIKSYVKLLEKPKKINFFSKSKKKEPQLSPITKERNIILDEFMNIAKNFIPINNTKREKDEILSCKSCGNTTFTQNQSSMICDDCGLEYTGYIQQNTYKDIDRVNMSQKYKYKRKVHFRDAINQYQGKQNKKINKKIFNDLENEFLKNRLIVETETEFFKRHAYITKEHIYLFLSQTKNASFYEDAHYIHRYFTGIPCPNISDIEAKLLEDFDKIEEVFETLPNTERKSILNSQYILFQLLRKHGKKVRESDFSILKTRDKILEHDLIYSKICEKLEWNFISVG